MKRHLLKYTGDHEGEYCAITYCNLDFENLSDKFISNLDENFTEYESECTCIRCLMAFRKDLDKHFNK